MAKGRFKPVFKRTLIEQSQLLKPQIENIRRENLSLGLYNSYRNEECVTKDLLVHEYPTRKELVQVNAVTGHTFTIKRIS
jgi:hypothetical protein